MLERPANIPRKPGVYLFMDDRGKILYVGKAKVLRTRVESYFRKSSGLDERKAAMMDSVAEVQFTVTGNELEALILEATLIKQHRPRYNILLRDDKSYPYLKLTLKEKWPRLEVVRRIHKDGSRYFGPYVPAGPMWETLTFIRRHYRIPNCRYSLEKRMRPCIQHQIRKCVAPCSGEVNHAEYMQMIREVELLLEGKNKKLLETLEKTMAKLSDDLRFEEAAAVRDRIRAIRSVAESQRMISPELGDLDIWGSFRQGTIIVFNVFFIRNGVLIGARDFTVDGTAGEEAGHLFRSLIEQFYANEIIPPPEVCCSAIPDDSGILGQWLTGRRGGRVRISVPSRGIRRKLVGMAEENAEAILKGRSAAITRQVTKEIALMLGLAAVPERIGAFDISNITGTSAVGAFVYWENGEFRKSRYRHIRMDEVKGPDDYAMMKEMIGRTIDSIRGRAEGTGEENLQADDGMPDLIIIDGGREHLKAAIEVLAPHYPSLQREEQTGDSEPWPVVVGLAKDPDRIFLRNRYEPILLDDSLPAALFLRKMRDEVHRFAIRYHRKQRSKKTFASSLDRIYGLGRQRRFALLDRFGSIEAIRSASVEDIAGLKGFSSKVAQDVIAALNAEKLKGEQA